MTKIYIYHINIVYAILWSWIIIVIMASGIVVVLLYPFFWRLISGLFCAAVAGQFVAPVLPAIQSHGVLLTSWPWDWLVDASEIPNNQPPGDVFWPDFFNGGKTTNIYVPSTGCLKHQQVAPDWLAVHGIFSQLYPSTDLRWISWSQALRARVGGTWTSRRRYFIGGIPRKSATVTTRGASPNYVVFLCGGSQKSWTYIHMNFANTL